MRRRRPVEVFSLSFLDCICCGFGAIILLLVLTEIGRPAVLEKSRKNLDGQVRNLTEQLHAIEGETTELSRELEGSRIKPLSGIVVSRDIKQSIGNHIGPIGVCQCLAVVT